LTCTVQQIFNIQYPEREHPKIKLQNKIDKKNENEIEILNTHLFYIYALS